MPFNTRLTELLKTDSRFMDDFGDLIISAVRDRAWRIDHDLIRLLLSDEEVKSKFFDQIDDYWVFNTNNFVDYVSQVSFLDNSYTRFRNKIGLTIGDEFISERGDVALAFPYKDCILEGGQTKEEEKRKEIFFNEVLAQDEINQLFSPKVLTHFKRYTVEGEQEVTDFKRDVSGVIQENLIIKGNNLLAMHTLVEQYRGQVKLIYIDPPYNTGNDTFGYNDNFNHSTWLTFIKNRLEIAKELLSSDGSIWINIDDTEAHYLKVLCDEVFGRDNFARNIVWQKRTSPDTRSTLGDGHDHILVYTKNLDMFKNVANRIPKTPDQISKFKNPDNDPRGSWVSSDFTAQGYRPNQMYEIVTPGGKVYKPPSGRCWKNVEKVFLQQVEEGRIWFGTDGMGVPRRKTYLSEVEDNAVWSWWSNKEVGHNQEAKKESIALFGADNPFLTPKPERLLQRIIHVGTNENDIVMDFFLGSGTTIAVAHKMNRQYIGIEQMNYFDHFVIPRQKKVVGKNSRAKGKFFDEIIFDKEGISEIVNWKGGNDFIFCELKKFNDVFIEKIQIAETNEAILRIWQDMAESSFLKWYINPEIPEDAFVDFVDIGQQENGLEKQKRLLIELLDKNQLYVNLTEIDDAKFDVSEEDKALNRAFYKEG